MAVGLLKGKGIKIVFLDPSRQVAGTKNIGGLRAFGRIRTVQQGPDGALWFTTSNGGGTDVIGRIAPSARPATMSAGQNVSPVGVGAVRVGSDLYVYARTGGNRIVYRRSTTDGRTWKGWASAGVTSNAAPSVASSGKGRVDLATIGSNRHIVLSRYVDRVRKSRTDLGGSFVTATVTSARSSRLDIFALRPDGTAARRHHDGKRWSGRHDLGGALTATIGASANTSDHRILLTGRGPSGEVWERIVTETSDGSGWIRRADALWSARALGDTRRGVGLVGASVGPDGCLVLRRGSLIQGQPARFTSAPDVVTRPDESWITFGRAGDATLSYVNGRKGQYRQVSLGGSLR